MEGAPVDPPNGGSAGAFEAQLGGAFQPLFDARAGHDVLAVAEAQPRTECAMLVPEGVELCVEPADVVADGRVVLGGEPMPQLRPLFTQRLDLLVDRIEGSHIRRNDGFECRIPQE
jgi:hypothetical protein